MRNNILKFNQGVSTPIGILIIVVVALVAGGILVRAYLEIKEITPPVSIIPSSQGNYILITHSEEKEKNILVFDINLQNYSVTSRDLSQFGEEFKNLGSEYIVPPEFNISSKIPFVKIETDSGGAPCEPEIPYLMAEIILPLSAEIESNLIDVKEEKLEEKIEIIPGIVCELKGECKSCPNYLKNNRFFPENILISQDISKFDSYILAGVYFPLFRHNPATRETYKIEKAEIKVDYTLSEDSLLILEKESIPSEIEAETFNVSYKIINPTLKEFKNLKIKIDLDGGASISYSPEFDIGSEASKIISFEVKSLWYPGSNPIDSYIIENSKLVSRGAREWVYFSQKEDLKPKLIHLTPRDFYGIIKDGWWVVYFWDERCKGCWQITPAIEEVSKELKELQFGEFDTSQEFSEQQMRYYNISAIPTLILLKDGEEIDRKAGRISKEELKIWLVSKTK